ncbi:TauD/TfdA dioxygenase family protein [Nocardia camponoti]|uniref:Alpha-ketoglutarate-dependent taurine dioxygenase n=1 Tax=Nocardia camponoti TaxID=1616106 RepID=A0A917Q8Y0_9NOCA|nr:TauD/TfdA family dioxygenase [Nocardia camponoti]GGK35257.1 alpha-ketoglutarate-dependent taurine dioxygenase [Nocardia camponoti]
MSASTTLTAPIGPFPLFGYPLVVGPYGHLRAERDRLRGLRWQHFDARLVGATLGAEISGVDLTVEQPAEVIAEITQALHDYKVLFFRDQPLTPAQHVRFARGFGELEIHPALAASADQPELVRFEKGDNMVGVENAWHHDVTWRERPSLGAILHAVDVPEIGGDTLFADMYAAHDSLDDETRAEIDTLDAVHDFTRAFGRGASPEQQEQLRKQHPSVVHPVVAKHAVTGRKHLYVNRIFTEGIVGYDESRSRELIDRLARRADAPEHQVRLKWEPDTVAFWDNRAVQHYAASDYWPQRRVVERASIIGPRPSR